MPVPELTAFLSWAEENEIKWDKDAIEIREAKHGYGLFAKKGLEAGYEAVQVPKAIVLSASSTGIANLLEEDHIEEPVALILACLYETSRGTESLWAPYLALLATLVPTMSLALTEEDAELLKKSEAYSMIEENIKEQKEEYDNIVTPFLKKHPEVFTDEVQSKFFKFEDYKLMTSQVSARAMDVDNYHLSAMVPFADFVNHNNIPNADFATYEDVCDICGALTCEHLEEEDDEEEDDEAPELEEKDAAKDKKKEGDEEDDDEEDAEWEDEINDTCDIIIDDDIAKGAELTRNYGPYPNKLFMSEYGFADTDNAHDTVTVKMDLVRKVVESVLGDAAAIEERVNWFMKVEDDLFDIDDDECIDDDCGHAHGHEHKHEKVKAEGETEEEEKDEEDEEAKQYLYLLSDGAMDDRLLVLLNLLFIEKEQFAKLQEDSDAVSTFFKDVCLRRALEEEFDIMGEDDEDEDIPTPELKPLDEAGRKVQKLVYETAIQLIRLRAEATGVTAATTAEEDMAALEKSSLTGLQYYAALCAQGEKKILQNGLQSHQKRLAEL